MNDFQETVALFDGSAVVSVSDKDEPNYPFPGKKDPPHPTYESFGETAEEPVNLQTIIPRWWPVTW